MTEQGIQEMVTIKKSVYEHLKKEYRFLGALKGAGVDNWDGYSYACEQFYENYPQYDEDKEEEDND